MESATPTIEGYMLGRTIVVVGLCGMLALVGCRSSNQEEAHQKSRVAVTLAPYRYFVERIAGDLVEVDIVVPAGADPHTFEPTPQQLEAAMHAKVWFCIGEPFERRMKHSLRTHRRDLLIADLREGWEGSLHAHQHANHQHEHGECPGCGQQDRHLWMSPRRAGHQAAFIAKTLSRAFPEHRDAFQKRLVIFQRDLSKLTQDLEEQLKTVNDRWILVSHPALGYFCEDFGLHQLSLEVEGKEATPQQLAHLIEEAKHLPLRCVITQSQHNPAGARWIAEQLGLQAHPFDPYSADYMNNLRSIAGLFSTARLCTPPAPSGLEESVQQCVGGGPESVGACVGAAHG